MHKEDNIMGKTIFSVMLKFPALETGSKKFGCQLILLGLLNQDFPPT